MRRDRRNPEHFMGFLPQIKDATDAVINLSTGGSLTNSVAERSDPAKRVSPEMTSLNMGSMNFSMHPLASKYQSWRFDWEHGQYQAWRNRRIGNPRVDGSIPLLDSARSNWPPTSTH